MKFIKNAKTEYIRSIQRIPKKTIQKSQGATKVGLQKMLPSLNKYPITQQNPLEPSNHY